MKVNGSVDVDAVLEIHYSVYVFVEKGVIAIQQTSTACISASRLMHLQVFLVDATGAVSCTLSFSPQSCVPKYMYMMSGQILGLPIKWLTILS